MKIELLKNPEMIRKRFIDRFLEDRDRFQITHKEFVKQLKEFDQWFDQSYMWDRLPHDVPAVTISQALELLKSRKGDVLFMSECEGFHATCYLPINGEKVEGFVAKADPKELADRIAYEWYEGWKLLQENRYPANFLWVLHINTVFLPCFSPNTRTHHKSRVYIRRVFRTQLTVFLPEDATCRLLPPQSKPYSVPCLCTDTPAASFWAPSGTSQA